MGEEPEDALSSTGRRANRVVVDKESSVIMKVAHRLMKSFALLRRNSSGNSVRGDIQERLARCRVIGGLVENVLLIARGVLLARRKAVQKTQGINIEHLDYAYVTPSPLRHCRRSWEVSSPP